ERGRARAGDGLGPAAQSRRKPPRPASPRGDRPRDGGHRLRHGGRARGRQRVDAAPRGDDGRGPPARPARGPGDRPRVGRHPPALAGRGRGGGPRRRPRGDGDRESRCGLGPARGGRHRLHRPRLAADRARRRHHAARGAGRPARRPAHRLGHPGVLVAGARPLVVPHPFGARPAGQRRLAVSPHQPGGPVLPRPAQGRCPGPRHAGERRAAPRRAARGSARALAPGAESQGRRLAGGPVAVRQRRAAAAQRRDRRPRRPAPRRAGGGRARARPRSGRRGRRLAAAGGAGALGRADRLTAPARLLLRAPELGTRRRRGDRGAPRPRRGRRGARGRGQGQRRLLHHVLRQHLVALRRALRRPHGLDAERHLGRLDADRHRRRRRLRHGIAARHGRRRAAGLPGLRRRLRRRPARPLHAAVLQARRLAGLGARPCQGVRDLRGTGARRLARVRPGRLAARGRRPGHADGAPHARLLLRRRPARGRRRAAPAAARALRGRGGRGPAAVGRGTPRQRRARFGRRRRTRACARPGRPLRGAGAGEDGSPSLAPDAGRPARPPGAARRHPPGPLPADVLGQADAGAADRRALRPDRPDRRLHDPARDLHRAAGLGRRGGVLRGARPAPEDGRAM
ncbi:MAG: hypothetical protein AVDCRST_MAG38-1228, partial [uncultured Solirubrobacteraceae bacterium]